MQPTSDEQIQFLVKLQRLLDEGLFVASYKFALLLALADISVEDGDDSGAAMSISTTAIAAKFVQYYWQQAAPYPTSTDARVLKQNTGQQAAIVNAIQNARATHGDSLSALTRNLRPWNQLVRTVADVVRVMPLWKLQTIGTEKLDFLYANSGAGKAIELRPGIAVCFRKFHALISDLVRGAWARYVRQQNLLIVGETTDLNEFLFGSERAALAVVRPVLMDIQQARCFYCDGSLTSANLHVDHFIPWARYPVDLCNNFVLADSRYNGKKRDRLPAWDHLAAWAASASTQERMRQE